MPFTNEGKFTGTITYYRDNFGLVKVANLYEAVWFQSEDVIGQIPQINVSITYIHSIGIISWAQSFSALKANLCQCTNRGFSLGI